MNIWYLWYGFMACCVPGVLETFHSNATSVILDEMKYVLDVILDELKYVLVVESLTWPNCQFCLRK